MKNEVMLVGFDGHTTLPATVTDFVSVHFAESVEDAISYMHTVPVQYIIFSHSVGAAEDFKLKKVTKIFHEETPVVAAAPGEIVAALQAFIQAERAQRISVSEAGFPFNVEVYE